MDFYPKIFIVIANYNGREVLSDCLNSLYKIDYPNFEVVVVDNNSQDGSLEAARISYPKVYYVKNEENFGFARANNSGIKLALEKMADYVLLLNNDTKVEKDFLSKLIETIKENPKIGIASPLVLKDNGPEVWFAGGKIDWWHMKTEHYSQKPATSNPLIKSPFISGCAMLVKAGVFKKIGLLDENFFLYWEDTDFSYRTKQAGFQTVVVPSSVIYHFEKSQKNLDKKIYWLVFSGLLFFQKNTPAYFRPWIKFYTTGRKIKNRLDVYRGGNEMAKAVAKAYKDYKDAKLY